MDLLSLKFSISILFREPDMFATVSCQARIAPGSLNALTFSSVRTTKRFPSPRLYFPSFKQLSGLADHALRSFY